MGELSFENLRNEIDPEKLHCKTTEDIVPLEGIIGQERAVRALKFGLDIKERGFNIYAAGLPGTGRETAVKDFLEELAKTKPVPSDWCYVNYFHNSYEPKAIELPPGKGETFQKDTEALVAEVRRVLPEMFQSEDYAAKRDATIKQIDEERKSLLSQLNKRAQEEGFILQSTQIGLLTIPVVDGKPLSDQEFMALSPEKRDEIQKKRERLTADLRNAMRQLKGLEAKAAEEVKNLNRERPRTSLSNYR